MKNARYLPLGITTTAILAMAVTTMAVALTLPQPTPTPVFESAPTELTGLIPETPPEPIVLLEPLPDWLNQLPQPDAPRSARPDIDTAFCEYLPAPGPGPVLLTEETMSLCALIVPYFPTWQDKVRALITVECESNGDPLANDVNWGHLRNRPQGIWSAMTLWTEDRSLNLLGFNIDPYDARESSLYAAALVYRGGGWRHWPECAGNTNNGKSRSVRETYRRWGI